MNYTKVPGVVLSNLKILATHPALTDIPPPHRPLRLRHCSLLHYDRPQHFRIPRAAVKVFRRGRAFRERSPMSLLLMTAIGIAVGLLLLGVRLAFP